MLISAFATPFLPFRASPVPRVSSPTSSLLKHRTHFPTYHCCHTSPQYPSPALGTSVEKHSCSRGADDGAQLASDELRSSGFPQGQFRVQWKDVLDVFADFGIKDPALSHVTQNIGASAILKMDAQMTRSVLSYLTEYLALTEMHLTRILLYRPEILYCVQTVRKAVHALETAELKLKDIRQIVLRWPGLLTLEETRINRPVAFLRSHWVGFPNVYLRSLLRRVPWVLLYNIDTEMAPAVAFLRETLMISDSVSIDPVIRACPLLLGTPRIGMQEVVKFLTLKLNLSNETVASMIKSYPPVLTCSLEHDIEPMFQYMTKEVQLDIPHFASIVRSFPAVLTLDVENDVEVVVDFFKNRGIRNIARIVTRLPPILGYDLETNILPKMQYIENELGLSSFDVLKFPGFFSYPLMECIEPRTKFLLAKGVSIAQIGLNFVLPLTEISFCSRIAQCPASEYRAFRKAYIARRWKEIALRETELGVTNPAIRERAEDTQKSLRDGFLATEASEVTVELGKRHKKRPKAKSSRMPWKELL